VTLLHIETGTGIGNPDEWQSVEKLNC